MPPVRLAVAPVTALLRSQVRSQARHVKDPAVDDRIL